MGQIVPLRYGVRDVSIRLCAIQRKACCGKKCHKCWAITSILLCKECLLSIPSRLRAPPSRCTGAYIVLIIKPSQDATVTLKREQPISLFQLHYIYKRHFNPFPSRSKKHSNSSSSTFSFSMQIRIFISQFKNSQNIQKKFIYLIFLIINSDKWKNFESIHNINNVFTGYHSGRHLLKTWSYFRWRSQRNMEESLRFSRNNNQLLAYYYCFHRLSAGYFWITWKLLQMKATEEDRRKLNFSRNNDPVDCILIMFHRLSTGSIFVENLEVTSDEVYWAIKTNARVFKKYWPCGLHNNNVSQAISRFVICGKFQVTSVEGQGGRWPIC